MRHHLRRPFARVERALYSWRAARRPASGSSEIVDGLSLFVPPTVLNPALFKTGRCLLRAARPYLSPASEVLDVGTGSGIVAVGCAVSGSTACAVDLNADAVRATTVNAMLNHTIVDVRVGDLFGPFQDRRFDVVTFNPPFFERVQGGRLALALSDGPGLPTLKRFVRELSGMLKPDGVALIVGSSNGALDAMRAAYGPVPWQTVRIEERGAERLVVDELTPR